MTKDHPAGFSRELVDKRPCLVCGRRIWRRRGVACGDCKLAPWVDTTSLDDYRRPTTLNGNPRRVA